MFKAPPGGTLSHADTEMNKQELFFEQHRKEIEEKFGDFSPYTPDGRLRYTRHIGCVANKVVCGDTFQELIDEMDRIAPNSYGYCEEIKTRALRRGSHQQG